MNMKAVKETVTTEVDALMTLVRRKGRISFENAGKELDLTTSTIESWATFLEEEGALSIEYKFTTPFLIFKSDMHEYRPIPPQGMRTEDDIEGQGDVSSQERLNTVSDLLNDGAQSVQSGLFEQADKTYTQVLSEMRSLFFDLKKNRPEDRPFEDNEVLEGLNTLGSRLGNVRDHIRKKSLQHAKKDFDRLAPTFYGTYSRIKSMYFENRSKKSSEELIPDVPKPTISNSSQLDVLLKEAYDLIGDNDFNSARKVYSQLETLYAKLPTEYVERKNIIKRDMVKLNRDLTINLRETFNVKVKETVKRVDDLVNIVKGKLKKKDLTTVKRLIDRMNALFAVLPEGYLEEKTDIKRKVTGSQKEYNKVRNGVYKSQIADIKQNVNRLITVLKGELSRSDILAAESTYRRLNDLFEDIPGGFLQAEIDIENQLLDAYKELLVAKEKNSNLKMEAIVRKINGMVAQAEGLISKNDPVEASKIYLRIGEEFKRIPDGFIVEKSIVEDKVLELGEKTLSKEKDFFQDEMLKKSENIVNSLKVAKKYIQNNQMDLANELFLEISKTFNTLPSGFLKQKGEIHNQILNVYKGILMSSDAKLLENMGDSVKKKYDDLLKMIVTFHKHLEMMELHLLEPNYDYIIRMYDQLPHGFVSKNNSIRTEIQKLKKIMGLYQSGKELEATPSEGDRIMKKILQMNKEINDPQAEKLVNHYIALHSDKLDMAKPEHAPIKHHGPDMISLPPIDTPKEHVDRPVDHPKPSVAVHQNAPPPALDTKLHPKIEHIEVKHDVFDNLEKIKPKKADNIEKIKSDTLHLIKNKDFKNASSVLEKFMEKEPDNVHVKKLKNRVDRLKKIAEADEVHKLKDLAMEQIKDRRYDHAIKNLNKIKGLQPGNHKIDSLIRKIEAVRKDAAPTIRV